MTSPPAAAATIGSRFALTRDQWTGLVFIQMWLLLLLRGWALFLDPGTFWHIVTGDRILTSGLPHQDWLSFTRAGVPWIAHQWLGEVAMSLLHRSGGFDALLVAFSASIALLFAWLFRRLVASGIAPGWSVLLTLLAFGASEHHFHARPHVASMFLFAWTFGLLIDLEAGWIGARRLLALVPAFALWSNLHGAAMGGLATVAIVAALWIASWALGRGSPVRRAWGAAFVAAIALVCFAMVLVNPYGRELPHTWLTIMASPDLARVMHEHQPFWVARTWLALGLLGVFVAALAAARWGELQATSLASLAWLALGIERTRHLPFFAIAAALVLPDLLKRSRWAGLPNGRLRILGAPQASPAAWPRWLLALPAAGLLAATTVHHTTPPARHGEPFLVTLSPERWPLELLPDLARLRAGLPPGSPILNDMLFGGFLAYHAPGLRIAIDDRWELYGDEFMMAYVERPREWLDRWILPLDPRLALLRPGSALDGLLASDAAWERVANTTAAVLYRRRADRPVAPAPVGTAGSPPKES